jgi:predicted TIM-barrel fold metal-dependent hydrolase
VTITESASSRNAWRLETPGAAGWSRSVHADDPNKLFVVSADTHANEPHDYLKRFVEPHYAHRLPHMERRDDGSEWMITEGNAPMRVRGPAAPAGREPHDLGSRMEEEDLARNAAGRDVAERLRHLDADGVDVELIFPNKGLLCWATPDPVFAQAMCRAWNRWAYEDFSPDGWHAGRTRPLASIAAGDLDGAMAEVRWAADHGWVGLCLGNSAVYGPKAPGKPEYNDPVFEPLWSLIEETGLPITFHVSTGRDPRAVTGAGGAVVNYVCHSMETTIEPLVQLIASGVLERHPRLQVGLVESGIGFVPWLIETMDWAHKAHHFWVRPQLAELPSTYFRRQCFASFQEDHAGLLAAEVHDVVDNLLWANDYPHHEGSWPHSYQSVERQFGHLREESRAKIQGLNAARIFGLDVTR